MMATALSFAAVVGAALASSAFAPRLSAYVPNESSPPFP
jgi:hypothetical protein